MRFSLRVLLALCLAGLQFVAVLTVVFSSYFTSEAALLSHARRLLQDVGYNTSEHAKGFLNPARGAAELAARLAQHRVVASDNQPLLEQLLFQQLQISPQFSGVYYGNENGDFVFVSRAVAGYGPYFTKIIEHDQGKRRVKLIWRNESFNIVARRDDPSDSYDPRQRPWYRMAKAKLSTIWTDPYIFFTAQMPGITLAAPVRKDAGVRGVVGVDIEISKISDFLAQLKIGQHGRALIMHRNGDVIAHPMRDLVKVSGNDHGLRFAKITELADPVGRAAFGGLLQDGALHVDQVTPMQFSYNGETYVSLLLPPISDALPWLIGVYAPEDDFTDILKANRSNNIWNAGIVALVTAGIGLILAEWIHRPVRAFADRSAQIAQADIAPDATAPRTYQELEKASTALVQQILARRSAENEYGQTFDLAARAMAQISATTGHILRANARFCSIVALPAEAVLGRGLSDFAMPSDYETFVANYDPMLATPTDYEMRWHRADGEVIWVKMNAIMIRSEEGQALHAVVTLDDITEEKARQVQIGQLNRDLSHLARGNTMGEMAAGLAHELNQPLTAVVQNADAACHILEGEPHGNPELQQILQEISQQSLRAGGIIRALRGFIRKDEGARRDFDLFELLIQVERLVRGEAVEADVQIINALSDLPKVNANHLQIAQVMINLLRNAIEAMAQGPAELRQLTVSAQRQGQTNRLQVTVADTGPGVAPDVLLFTQFETTKPDGMGLGLSICRSMVEANDGELWYEPNLPQGARFCFTLSIAAGISGPAAEARDPSLGEEGL